MEPHAADPLLLRLRANLAGLLRRVEAARQRAPYAAPAVRILPVTKSCPPRLFPLLAAAGVAEVAENRVQAAEARRPLAPEGWLWHGIGHLQRNKAKRAVAVFDVFHALDSLALARHLDSVLASANRSWPVYIQVNAADDPRKGGIAPAETAPFVKALADLPHLAPLGFMTMARIGAGPSESRAAFRTLREVRDEIVRQGLGAPPPTGLSMGMSEDFETAVEEGATVVRIGTAVFEGLELADAATARDAARGTA